MHGSNGSEFKLQFLEPMDISKYLLSPNKFEISKITCIIFAFVLIKLELQTHVVWLTLFSTLTCFSSLSLSLSLFLSVSGDVKLGYGLPLPTSANTNPQSAGFQE